MDTLNRRHGNSLIRHQFSLEDCSSFLLIDLFCHANPLQNTASPTPLFFLILVPAAVQQLRHSIAINSASKPAIPTLLLQVEHTPHRSVITTHLPVILDSTNAVTTTHHPFFEQSHPPRRRAQQIDKSSLSFFFLVRFLRKI